MMSCNATKPKCFLNFSCNIVNFVKITYYDRPYPIKVWEFTSAISDVVIYPLLDMFAGIFSMIVMITIRPFYGPEKTQAER